MMNTATTTAVNECMTTWSKLSTEIALSIQQLIAASQNTSTIKNDLQAKTSNVVRVIRLMLYASGFIEKNSDISQNPLFREPRKMLVSSLSKLVLSTRMASETPRQPNVAPIVTQKIQREANDVLVAARNYVSTFTQHNIPLQRIHPELINEDIETNSSSSKSTKFFLNQDLISNLQAHTNQIYTLTDELSLIVSNALQKYNKPTSNEDDDNIREERDVSVTMYRTLSTQITQFAGILDEINFENVHLDYKLDFNTYISSRQSLYESVGLLFSSIQSFTDKHINMETICPVINDTLVAIRKALQDIEQVIAVLVNERKRNMSITNDDYITMSPIQQEMRIPSLFYEDDMSSSRDRSFFSQDSVTESRKSSLDMMFPAPPSRKPVRSIDTATVNSHDSSNERIEFGNDNTIKGGTLAALVERLTAHDTFGNTEITIVIFYLVN